MQNESIYLQASALGRHSDRSSFWYNSLKEYAHKDYLSFQKKGVGETNILQKKNMKIGRSVS